MRTYLDFEKPLAELEGKIEELRAMGGDDAFAIGDDLTRLEAKAAQALKELYGALTPWQKTQVARHPERPRCGDYLAALAAVFVAAFFIGGAVVPQSTVDSWTQQAEESSHSQTPDEPENPADSDH